MVQRFQYVVVELGLVLDEKRLTERINGVAEHGWRLIETLQPKSGRPYAIFEKPIDD